MKYAYRNGENWLYRRKYPQDVKHLFPTEFHKVSLKTKDEDVARLRVVSENKKFDRMVESARSGSPDFDRLEEELQREFDARLRWLDDPETNARRFENSDDDPDEDPVEYMIDYLDGEAHRSLATGEYGWPDDYHEEVIRKLALPDTPAVRTTVVKAIALMRLHCAQAMMSKIRHEPLPERPKVFVEGASPVRGQRVEDLIRSYSAARRDELSKASLKSLDYALRLFGSTYGHRYAETVTQKDLRGFAEAVARLSPSVAKSPRNSDIGLSELLGYSQHSGGKISAGTQKRLLGEVQRFWTWCEDHGFIETSPVPKSFGPKPGRPKSYAVLTDEEAEKILAVADPALAQVMHWCMLSGMRAGECLGLTAEDLIDRGNDGWWVHIRPNDIRDLKSAASNRIIPLHSDLVPDLEGLAQGWPAVPEPDCTQADKVVPVGLCQGRR